LQQTDLDTNALDNAGNCAFHENESSSNLSPSVNTSNLNAANSVGQEINLKVTTPTSSLTSATKSNTSNVNSNQPKRLHVSNIPFRFRDPDLRQLFGVCLF